MFTYSDEKSTMENNCRPRLGIRHTTIILSDLFSRVDDAEGCEGTRKLNNKHNDTTREAVSVLDGRDAHKRRITVLSEHNYTIYNKRITHWPVATNANKPNAVIRSAASGRPIGEHRTLVTPIAPIVKYQLEIVFRSPKKINLITS